MPSSSIFHSYSYNSSPILTSNFYISTVEFFLFNNTLCFFTLCVFFPTFKIYQVGRIAPLSGLVCSTRLKIKCYSINQSELLMLVCRSVKHDNFSLRTI